MTVEIEKKRRIRFSIRALLALVTLLALVLGGWIAYSNYEIRQLVSLRQRGAIVIIRDRTPGFLKAVGIKQLHPFFSVPTVELYVTPQGDSALVGNSDQSVSKAEAQTRLLEQAALVRSYGAQDVQLISIGAFDPEWAKFAADNSMASISENRERYSARLKANQQSGANINP